ncbi:MAG: hypothetical protein AAF899_16775 [Pseudomonadota bacterium]
MTRSSKPSEHLPGGSTDAFAFGDQAQVAAGLRQMALMWSLPMRAMMVVMSEVYRPGR